MVVKSSALQAVEWCNPSTSCYGFCCSIAFIASGDGRQMINGVWGGGGGGGEEGARTHVLVCMGVIGLILSETTTSKTSLQNFKCYTSYP